MPDHHPVVMPGLDPGIHAPQVAPGHVDGRVEPGHDKRGQWLPRRALAALVAATALCGCAGEDAAPGAVSGAPQCPPWVDFPASLHSNLDSPYLGCSNRSNLANEIDRPADLAAGRTLGPDDGARASLGIANWQQGKLKSFGTNETVGPTIVMPGATSGSQ